jgi:hypothetical protein
LAGRVLQPHPLQEDSVADWWLARRKQVHKEQRKSFDSIITLLNRCIWKERNAKVFDRFYNVGRSSLGSGELLQFVGFSTVYCWSNCFAGFHFVSFPVSLWANFLLARSVCYELFLFLLMKHVLRHVRVRERERERFEKKRWLFGETAISSALRFRSMRQLSRTSYSCHATYKTFFLCQQIKEL